VTKITKHEMIEGEIGRFVLNKGEEPQAMYNRLKTMVNQVRNLGSTKWDDHEMIKVILRSFIFLNPSQVQLIHGDPRYKQMSPEEVIGKFVSFELMIKDSKHIINLEQGATSTPEVQPVAFKATEEKEESTPSRLPIDASKLDNEEMTLIIKSFRQILKQRKGKDYKPSSKRVCYRCGKSGHFIANCPYSSDSDRDDDKKGKKKMEKKRYYKKKGGVGVWSSTAHPGLPLEVLLGRTVLLTVTQWFVRDARETVTNFLQVWAAFRHVTPYFLVWFFMWWVTREVFSMEKASKLSRWSMNLMGYPLGLIYLTVGHYMRV
jgi:hypothetical protein